MSDMPDRIERWLHDDGRVEVRVFLADRLVDRRWEEPRDMVPVAHPSMNVSSRERGL